MNDFDLSNRSTPRWRRPRMIALGAAALLVTAAGIAWATGVGPAMIGHGHCRAGVARDFAEFRIHRALERVGATAEQEQRIMAIVDGLFARHREMRDMHEQLHGQLLTALTGPTVDRAAIESVRSTVVARIDQGSRDLARALGDAAEVLTPEQRLQLAALAKEHMEQ
ncbi:MAG: Spy/CpxP family protein refolding chaperone [Acidobacteriota bacterium]